MMLAALPPAYLSWTLAAVVTVFTGTFVLVMFLPKGRRMTDEEIVLHKIAKNLGLPPDCIYQDTPKEYSRAREQVLREQAELDGARQRMARTHEMMCEKFWHRLPEDLK